ncbi:MAG: hypothetical protein ACRDE8_09235 [Ginsengibacter sp.]
MKKIIITAWAAIITMTLLKIRVNKESLFMNQPAEIILHLISVEDILLKRAGPLNCKQLLNNNTEEFIVEEAGKFQRRSPLHFTVHVPPGEIQRADEVVKVIHTHFSYCRKKSENKLKHTLQLGWRSLFIGFAFLIIMYFLVQMLVSYLPQGGFVISIRELLIILSWVALWRPAELLLYEWYPFKRDADLFHRLEQSTVKVIEFKVL